jgi:hypothetical protein
MFAHIRGQNYHIAYLTIYTAAPGRSASVPSDRDYVKKQAQTNGELSSQKKGSRIK